MGTRGAFGVIIGEQEKIGYNQMDSYPGGWGVENLQWLRDADLIEVRQRAEAAVVVDNDTERPTKEQQEALVQFSNTGVSEQSTEDWYCLLRETHGHIGRMLEAGFIEDNSGFPLDSLFCEWAYIVDLDRNVLEVYEGFQKKVPRKGRWAGRPTSEENAVNHQHHLKWCKKNGRDPWLSETPDYKAVELIASWPLDALPSDEEFLARTQRS